MTTKRPVPQTPQAPRTPQTLWTPQAPRTSPPPNPHLARLDQLRPHLARLDQLRPHLARLARPGRLRPHLEPKRLLDVTLGSALLLLASPVLAAAALALALSRPAGGVFVRDYRTGFNGHPFLLSSLRTRRFRLDLLSRLPHVVRGHLSLVGPAPLTFGSPAAAAPWRQLVRPGLTGLAQVRRHSALPWNEAPLLDQHYVEQHWIGLDLSILARTPGALMRRVRVASATQITGPTATLRRNKWVPSARAD
ncbi:sugar transferase [Streptomyces sp. NPDC059255]|uniref:sugar transferase n=1 Tax=Streptomyces sp. NPDC059255 TaxID=3346793 RepID=UPI0036868F85